MKNSSNPPIMNTMPSPAFTPLLFVTFFLELPFSTSTSVLTLNNVNRMIATKIKPIITTALNIADVFTFPVKYDDVSFPAT